MSKADEKKWIVVAGVAAVGVTAAALLYKFYFSKPSDEKAGGSKGGKSSAAAPAKADASANADIAIASIDFSRASKLSKEQIAALWEKYDTDKSGSLEPNEIKALVKAVLGQIYQEKSVLTKYMTHMFDDSTDHTHKHEIHGRLRVLHKELHDKSDGVAKELFNRLDTDKNGKISKDEFVVAFALWLENKQQQEIRNYLL